MALTSPARYRQRSGISHIDRLFFLSSAIILQIGQVRISEIRVLFQMSHPCLEEFRAAVRFSSVVHPQLGMRYTVSVSYTHLTLPTIYSV